MRILCKIHSGEETWHIWANTYPFCHTPPFETVFLTHTHHLMACSSWKESQGNCRQTWISILLPQSSFSKHDGPEHLHLQGLIPSIHPTSIYMHYLTNPFSFFSTSWPNHINLFSSKHCQLHLPNCSSYFSALHYLFFSSIISVFSRISVLSSIISVLSSIISVLSSIGHVSLPYIIQYLT